MNMIRGDMTIMGHKGFILVLFGWLDIVIWHDSH